ncbi:hypothetical protein THAOC_37434, partial [Thalassiosira oceanica]
AMSKLLFLIPPFLFNNASQLAIYILLCPPLL